MKTLKTVSLLLIIAFLSQSCLKDDCTALRKYVQYNPVFMTGNELTYEVKAESERALINPGKIYFYKNHIFINEKGLGVHVYNNENPSAPEYVTFYSMPGNFDIAIKNDIMYADNPLYLMSIDIEDMLQPEIVSRQKIKDQEWWYENLGRNHVIYYTKTDIVENLDCSDNNFNNSIFQRGGTFFLSIDVATENVFDGNSNGGTGSQGVGGSTARFTLYDDYLYTVDHSSLHTWDIENATSPERVATKNLGWGIETIFPYEDKLFIGSNAGMFIFDNSNPSNPVQKSTFQHATACDPVVVRGDRAYVTLRSGNNCRGINDQLDVIDVSNINNPKLVKTFQMKNPHGLAIRDNNLFICEGAYGLRIFDASDDERITKNELANVSNVHAVDIISLTDKLAFMIGEDGFFQYDMSNVSNPRLLSSIKVQKQ